MAVVLAGPGLRGQAQPVGLRLSLSNGVPQLDLPVLPAIEAYEVLATADLGAGFAVGAAGRPVGYVWTSPAAAAQQQFLTVRLKPVEPATLLASIVLERLAYGPTPDDLVRVLTGPQAIGPDAYIAEQLTPERIADDLDALPQLGDWQYVSVTGAASSSTLYLYLTSAGEVFVDDLVLVRGDGAGTGPNLLRNGDFESPLAGAWTVSANHAATAPSARFKKSGASSLRVVATEGGTTRDSAVWQTVSPALKVGDNYTLSYWYLPSTNGAGLRLRLSGSDSRPNALDVAHPLVPNRYLAGSLHGKLSRGEAGLNDLRAWHTLHAVRSPRQLHEVLTQFFDNHFNTQWSKSRDYIDGLVTNKNTPGFTATDFEFRELSQWRAVLADPNGTFLDLLRVSAESPAMVIYLDTVSSSGGNANENYSRELLELFALGVDNGYDQTDIEQMARAWTGWRVDKLPPGQATNPFATPVADRDHTPGVWALRFRPERHDNAAKTIFKGKTLSPRFGPPLAGRSYQLNLPARTGTAGMQDGYDILRQLADLPPTQEYLSVKLCRLFVHENFQHGLYDYTSPALAAEGRLVQACMAAWEQPGPDGRKGNLRRVLATIFASDLFRQNTAAAQKVKTPFEYVVSTIRALRAARPDGTFTADTDGYDVLTTLSRLNLRLFDRAEPDGWSEAGRDWVSTSALVERMRFAQNFMIAPRDPLKAVDFGSTGKDNIADPVALLRLRLPAGQWRAAEGVVDFFLQLLFPGEGRANLDLDRIAAVLFLDSADSGEPGSSRFSALDPDASAYDTRVRSLVALLLGLPRFQEQ